MHPEIFTKEQNSLLPLVKLFNKDYYLVGGTAIALYLGHRYSIDFDLFSEKKIKRKSIKRIFDDNGYSSAQVIYEEEGQIHIMVRSVKMTFFQFPHVVQPKVMYDKIIKMPDLLDLAAMKAYALGGRAKWKDYVDLFFLIKRHFSLTEISNHAHRLFNDFFNDKLFREQLSYFDDIDYSEPVTYLSDPVPDEDIKQFLSDQATQAF